LSEGLGCRPDLLPFRPFFGRSRSPDHRELVELYDAPLPDGGYHPVDRVKAVTDKIAECDCKAGDMDYWLARMYMGTLVASGWTLDNKLTY
jgi:hypothetical protein